MKNVGVIGAAVVWKHEVNVHRLRGGMLQKLDPGCTARRSRTRAQVVAAADFYKQNTFRVVNSHSSSRSRDKEVTETAALRSLALDVSFGHGVSKTRG